MISVICATRGRPHFMERVVKSARQAANGEIQFIWFIDEDDTESQLKAHELEGRDKAPDMIVLPRGSVVLSETINICYKLAKADIVHLIGDDVVYRTKNWDKVVEAAFEECPDKILLCGAHDGGNKDLITHPFLHRNWIEAVGRLVPPYFRDCYVDTWLNDVAKMLGRRRWLPIFIEHMHYSSGKSEFDQTAQERVGKISDFDESAIIFYEKREERMQEAHKLMEFTKNATIGN